MKLAIMQPYFFPYIGYLQLIHATDKFILFDDVQYIRHGWINRNRVLKPNEGWQYIVAPLQSHSQRASIKEIRLQPGREWKDRIIRQLEHYKKRAPFYVQTAEVVNACLATDEENITKLNADILTVVCRYINLRFEYKISSSNAYDYSNVNDAGEWALRIAEQEKASEYINPSGGSELFDDGKFINSNIKLHFLKPDLKEYNQRRKTFEPGLSIIDIMMYNSPEEIRSMLNCYEIV